MQNILFNGQDTVQVRALFLGERLDIRALEKSNALATLPLVIEAGKNGCVVLFRYGAAVLFGLSSLEEQSFLGELQPRLIEPFTKPETEAAILELESLGREKKDSVIRMKDFSVGRVQIVADVLAKSVVLAHYEMGTAKIFEQIEPFAQSLQRATMNDRHGKDLLKQLGRTLSIQNKIVGRVEIIDKPEILWDAPELERIYARLEKEYEIRERQLALERKLGLVSQTAETVLDLMQHNTGLRVEWYVVILIVVEIFLSLYDIFLKR